MKGAIIGAGEVGKALYAVVSPVHETILKDIEPWEAPSGIEVMHVCLDFIHDWENTVLDYAKELKPKIINIQTTAPPGSTRTIQEKSGIPCVHSTTRGLHPNLEKSIKTFVKHIGGPEWARKELAFYFEQCGVSVWEHETPETTELAHILSNALYGVNIMFADEMAKLCREYGVDYHEAHTVYTMTCNEGYRKLGHSSKQRMLLTPPNGKIGGHCVVYGAGLIPEKKRGPLLQRLSDFNEKAIRNLTDG